MVVEEKLIVNLQFVGSVSVAVVCAAAVASS